MAKKKTFSFSNEADDSDSIESLDGNVNEDNGFIEGDVSFGKTLATFNFSQQNDPAAQTCFAKHGDVLGGQADDKKSAQVQMDKPLSKGLTPPIDGEQFTIKRCYQFRPTTLRKLKELKAKHEDLKVCYNTILDEAILHYYEYCSGKNISR